MFDSTIEKLKRWLIVTRDKELDGAYAGASLKYIQELEDKLAEQAVLLQENVRKVAGDPENKNWDTSYTKIVYTDLLMGRPGARVTAADLLRDYHDSAHVVYEQRDQARQQRDAAERTRDMAVEKATEAKREPRKIVADTVIALVAKVGRVPMVNALATFGVFKVSDIPEAQLQPFLEVAISKAIGVVEGDARSWERTAVDFGARGKAVTEELRQMRIQRNQARNDAGRIAFYRDRWADMARGYATKLGMIKRIAA